MEGRSAFDFGGNRIIRQSEPTRIGKHEWRLTLYRSDRSDRPLIGYEWRRMDGAPIRCKCPIDGYYYLDGSTWMRDQEWPSYNHNDGQYAGLPRTLGRFMDHSALRWRHDETFYPDPGETMMALRQDGRITHLMYHEGAHILARDLGFMNSPALKGWADRHPKMWGGSHGERMFAGDGAVAFGKPPFAPVMVSDIIARWLAVADRLDEAIPVHRDHMAAFAALKCHDLHAQENIAIEPCKGGYRLARRPYPVSLLALQA